MAFITLEDGSALERHDDGSYRPVQTQTDWAYLDGLSDDEIERMAASDPDHPALDDEFWAAVDARTGAEPVAIDRDVIDFFRATGRDVDGRINAVLRDHVTAQTKRTGS